MIGKRVGSCEITAKLGEGGMGEVYQATDTRLKREVAIKVFFLAHDQHLMSATVSADGRTPTLGLPRQLFAVQKQVTYLARTSRWAAMPDGDRFLVLEPLSDGSALRQPLMLLTPLDGRSGRSR